MKSLVSLILLLFAYSTTVAQDALEDKVLFTVEDDVITAEEYMAVYNKNRNLGQDIDPKTPSEYLDLYTNFKLKVHNAKELGMDTIPSFLNEYRSYRNQLTKPYLTDKGVTDKMVKEAYSRMKEDIKVAHILVMVKDDASAKDTLEAYTKIMRAKERISKGEDFGIVSKEVSEDTYAAENNGVLGYYTVFNLVYPFETAMYNAKVGELVGPVRTQFGYHLIKTLDRRPARGEIQVAHIMIVSNQDTPENKRLEAKQKVDEIYEQIVGGADFASLAKQHSDDQNSSFNAGVIQAFGINRMYPEFEEVAFSLEKVGDFSKPVKTPAGWHIIKLIKKDGMPTFEDAKGNLKVKVERDARAKKSKTSIIKRLKKEYSYQEFRKNKQAFFSKVDKKLKKGQFRASELSKKSAAAPLFKFASKEYKVGDFAAHLEKNQGVGIPNTDIDVLFNKYATSMIIEYEKTQLESKYPEFRLLSREYYEGILLFDLTEKMVWRKSISDSAGLVEFYEANKGDYTWDTRYDVAIVDANSKKIAKKAKKLLKKGKSVDEVQAILNEESQLNVDIEAGVFELNGKPVLENFEISKTGFTKVINDGGRYKVIKVNAILNPTTKTLKEAKGAVVSHYQTHLEDKWIKELKESYKVRVNDEVLKQVIDKLENQ